ncbi:hypothetical protein GIB67_026179 [Kingdonia uniflora]|uniref:Uncharacterized protein n=1 Tax=Kingdonia uniflora TaxID=39325 RepID=A0A7J7M360_9MAGN|nr:hypothetical protein GIB67_026179 [Kingdonia uniflora]
MRSHTINHENVSMEILCRLHGWGTRESPRRVFDAVLFSNEVDILTILWNELYSYITQFVLLESNSTLTGLLKHLIFAGHRDQFKFIDPRFTYGTIGGRFKKGENPFAKEAYQRVALDQLLKIVVYDKSWRASVHRYQTGKTRYAHFWQTDDILSDAGWHCSFCLLLISEFVFKMKAYIHFDKVRFSYYLNPKRVQDIICKGSDLFDMLPEEFIFKDIIGKLGSIPHSFLAVHLPPFILNNAENYKFSCLGTAKGKVGNSVRQFLNFI